MNHPACPNCNAVYNVQHRGLGSFLCSNCGTEFRRLPPIPQNTQAVETGWINVILSVN